MEKAGEKTRFKIFVLEVELYCKVNKLNFQVFLNKPDEIIFLKIKQKVLVHFSSYGHSLVPKRGVTVPKKPLYASLLPNHTLKALTENFYLIGSFF